MTTLPRGRPIYLSDANVNDKLDVVHVLICLGLSRRQAEVASFLVDGLSNKEIAEKLFITPKTVKFHLYCAFKILKVSNRTQCALKARGLCPER